MRSKNINPNRGLLIFVIAVIVIALWCIVSGIIGLIGRNKINTQTLFENGYHKGDFFEGEISYGSDCVLCMKHTINFIPAAYEYYYVIMSEDFSGAALVRADKHFGENFVNGTAAQPLNASGRVKATEYKTERELTSVQSELAAIGIHLSIDNYVDLLSSKYYTLRIAAGIAYVAILTGFAFVFRSQKSNKFVSYENGAENTALNKTTEGKLVIVLTLLMMAVLVLSLHLMEMR